jgi:hypothetical protein
VGEAEVIRKRQALTVVLAGSLTAAVLAVPGLAAAPPVGPLPTGPKSTIQTEEGQLIAFALPKRPEGRVWRVARRFDARVVRQVSEGEIARGTIVVVFRAVAPGTANVVFALTRGETAKALESRRYTVRVR